MQQSSYQQIHSSNELQGDKYRFRCSANISMSRELISYWHYTEPIDEKDNKTIDIFINNYEHILNSIWI